MPLAEQLYRLQTLDSRLARLEAEHAALDDGSGLRARVEQSRAEEARAREVLHQRQAHLRALELELQSTIGKARKVEQEMYSGRVANPKELQAMEQDVQALHRQRSRLEDIILAEMEAVEQAMADLRHKEAQRAELERALDQHLRSYQEATERLAAGLASGRAEREAYAATLDPDLLRRYERLRSRKDGLAVAAVIGGVCEGCHMAVPEGRLARLQEGDDALVTCEDCGRILYAPR